MEKPLISLCMIVKDEANYLPRCLESVRDSVDEMIIVDTGSKDHTKEIAASYGAKVFNFEWRDDFSIARNFSLEQATGAWILVLDADEELESQTAKRLRDITQQSEVDAYLMIQRNFYRGRLQHTLDIETVRFFRNCSTFRFRGRYHETIHQSIIEHNGKIGSDKHGLIIFHDGYMRSTAQGKSRRERAIHHMKRALEEDPSCAWLYAKLGIELHCQGQDEEAYQYLMKFIQFDSKSSNLAQINLIDTHEALIHLADLANQRGEYTIAKYCGLAGRQLSQLFELRMYSEFAFITGTLGETQTLLDKLYQQRGLESIHQSNPELLSSLREKLGELTELEIDIKNLKDGFYSLLTPYQRKLLSQWLNQCREFSRTIQQLIQP